MPQQPGPRSRPPIAPGKGAVSPASGATLRDWRIVVTVCALIWAAFAPAQVLAQTAQEYRLGVDDRLLVKVGRWRAAEGRYENWDGLGGEYVVGPDGTISIALAGSVAAQGRTPAELAGAISRRIQAQIGIDEPPAISVEITGFRPIYVVGAVNKPGEFPYRPQLSVLQAIGLAGGHLRAASAVLRTERDALQIVGEYRGLRLQRWNTIARIARLEAELAGAEQIDMPAELAEAPNAAELLRMEGEILAARNAESRKLRDKGEASKIIGEYRVLRLQRWREIARVARLEAELAGAGQIDMPEELAEAPDAAELLRMEAEILAARNETVRSEKQAIEDLKQVLATQIEKMDEEVLLRNQQIELATAELEDVRSLIERGLAVASRESGLARTVTESKAKLLVLEVAKLRAEQQLNEAIRDELELVNNTRRTIVTELQEARDNLEQIDVKLETANDLSQQELNEAARDELVLINETRRRIITELQAARDSLEQIDVRLETAKALFSEAAALGGNMVSAGDIGQPTYALTRRIDGQASTQIVDEQSLMRPGDILQVIAPELEPDTKPGSFPELPG